MDLLNIIAGITTCPKDIYLESLARAGWHIFSCRTAKDEYKPDENDLFLPMNHLKDGEGT